MSIENADSITTRTFAALNSGVTELPTETPQPRTSAGQGLLVPNQDFGSRYHIIKALGAGGMGAVYEAWDRELGVSVALKVVRLDAGTEPGTVHDLERRFKRELLLARQVTHKNVVRIHDLGEIEGTKYITMPYLKGADLATVLRNSGTLPIPAALRIARQLVSGLQAAHDAGVIHRDLKPANIMIEDDNAIIMDFGIAQSNLSANEVPSAPLSSGPLEPAEGWHTNVGVVIGSVSYMAPEQARGEPIDQRADLYSFGLILRDMLVGKRCDPDRRQAMEELKHRLEHGVVSARSVKPEIPEALDQVIFRCLSLDAASRYQTSGDLAAELDRLDENGEPLPILRRAIAFSSPVATAEPAQREPVSVLVADFENRSGDPVFEGAVEHALILALEEASYITVFKSRDAKTIAAELSPDREDRITEEVGQLIARREGLKVLLVGAISKLPGGYRVDVKATEPATGQQIAAVKREVRQKDEVLGAVASMAARVREALGESSSDIADTDAAETVSAGSLESMRAYARAQELTMANKVQGALQEYERAVHLDPRFGRAYAGMAVIYSNYFKEMEKAEASYQEAFKHLDRMTDRERYRTLGTYYLNVAHNYEKAIENYETLARLYPADDGAHGNLALASVLVGDIARAQMEVRKSLQLYPRNSIQLYNYAMYSMYAGDFATAINEASRLHTQNPSFEYAFLPIAVSQLVKGDATASRDAYDRMSQISEFGASFATLGIADTHMYFGRQNDAIRVLREGIAVDAKHNSVREMAQKYVALAEACLAAGRKPEAVRAAQTSIKLNRHESTLSAAARVLVHAGREKQALKIAEELEKMLQRHTIASARLIAGEAAFRRGRLADAIEAFREARKRQDLWFSRFLLGRTYVEAGHFPEALTELEACVKRCGETTDAFFYDLPTARYLPPIYYWLARAQQGVGVTSQARQNYDRFLQLRAEADPDDVLVSEARGRMLTLSK